MTQVVDPYVKSRLDIARQRVAEAQASLDFLRAASRTPPGATGPVPVVVTHDVYTDLDQAWQIAQDLAFGLDDAMHALNFYANENTWTEVPAKTLAADDRGERARVALARINPV